MNKKKFLFTIFFLLFLMMALPYFGAGSLSPSSVDVFTTLVPKLTQKSNDFVLLQSFDLVSKAGAATDLTELPSFVVIDFDSGKILDEKNSSEQLPIASLTKIMTAVVALDLASPEELFTYSQNARNQPATRLAFNPGDKLTLEELLNGALLTSANDCVEAIKEGVNAKYQSDVFIKAMNEKAKFLNLKNTHFENPQGFDGKQQYSSTADLAVLAHYALSKYPLIAQIVAKDHGELPATSYHSRAEYLNNWNGLIGVYPGVSGVKIGNTDEAGKTTAVVSKREDKKVLAVLLGAADIIKRDLYASQLLDIGFERLAGLPPVEVTQQQLLEKYATWKYEN